MSDLLPSDAFNDECGIVAVWGHAEASNLCYLGLHALQHRGQEGAGIVSSDGQALYTQRGRGLVADVFGDRAGLQRLLGNRAIGHVRYSTSGGNSEANVQPLTATWSMGQLAVAHNGNYVNARSIRDELEAEGAIFQSSSDTEVVVHLIARSRQKTFVNRVVDALARVQGAGSIVFLNEDMLLATRDPHGFRPLVIGRLPGGGWVLASETCALDLIGARVVRDVSPGEVVVIDDGGLSSFHPFPRAESSACIFEYLYFARPDTQLWGKDVYSVRLRLGDRLAVEQPADVDMVLPVPDSGVAAALGYARKLGKPFELGLVRNHYVGRSFIEPTQMLAIVHADLSRDPVGGIDPSRE